MLLKDKTVLILSLQFGGYYLDPIKWENSIYKPTPTIIEAAQALYQGHSVKEISRSDSGAENLISFFIIVIHFCFNDLFDFSLTVVDSLKL